MLDKNAEGWLEKNRVKEDIEWFPGVSAQKNIKIQYSSTANKIHDGNNVKNNEDKQNKTFRKLFWKQIETIDDWLYDKIVIHKGTETKVRQNVLNWIPLPIMKRLLYL